MTVFRSKLFTFRSPDGKEYAIGPAIVLETILKTIDQKIDRRRATERLDNIAGEENFDHVVTNLKKFLDLLDSHTEPDAEHTGAGA